MKKVIFVSTFLCLNFLGDAFPQRNGKPSLKKIRLSSLQGDRLDLEHMEGKMVFLNFWATWCKPCVQELPSIQRASEILGEEGFVFLLASDEDPEKIMNYVFLKGFNMDLMDFVRLDLPFVAAGVESVPTTYLIDRNGNLVMHHVGIKMWDDSETIAELRELSNINPED